MRSFLFGLILILNISYAQAGKVAQDGIEAAKGGDYDQAITILQPLAEGGDPQSQYSLGVLYENGQGVKQDYVRAFYWYKRAADQGQVKADYNLGYLFMSGKGGKVDYAKAMGHFSIAAKKGYPPAQYNLAYMFEKGLGADVDFSRAFEWYQKAAEAGLSKAQFSLAGLYASGQGTQKNPAKAIYWYEKLVKYDARPDARLPLAMLWLEEPGMQEKGINLLRKVAEEGQARAQFQLGYAYGQGNGVVRDYEQATFWYFRAARQKVPEAEFLLCLSYSLGRGVPVDVVRAHVWCDAATKHQVEGAVDALQSVREVMTDEQLKEAKELALILTQ